jgi:hypothetical protein
MIRAVLVFWLSLGTAMAVEAPKPKGILGDMPAGNAQGWKAEDPTAQAIINRPLSFDETYDLVASDLKRLRAGEISQDEFNQKWMRPRKQ